MLELTDSDIQGGYSCVGVTPDASPIAVSLGSSSVYGDESKVALIWIRTTRGDRTLDIARITIRDPDTFAVIQRFVQAKEWPELADYCWDMLIEMLTRESLQTLLSRVVQSSYLDGHRAATGDLQSSFRKLLGIADYFSGRNS